MLEMVIELDGEPVLEVVELLIIKSIGYAGLDATEAGPFEERIVDALRAIRHSRRGRGRSTCES
jgi:hypothetical protein